MSGFQGCYFRSIDRPLPGAERKEIGIAEAVCGAKDAARAVG